MRGWVYCVEQPVAPVGHDDPDRMLLEPLALGLLHC